LTRTATPSCIPIAQAELLGEGEDQQTEQHAGEGTDYARRREEGEDDPGDAAENAEQELQEEVAGGLRFASFTNPFSSASWW
jgi:hypothetical protein